MYLVTITLMISLQFFFDHYTGGDPANELVRHFLIEPNARGVRLKGCVNEPIFGSLSALIYQHTLTQLALPCKLALPDVGKCLGTPCNMLQYQG